MSSNTSANILADITFFKGFDPASLTTLQQEAKEKHYPKNTLICLQHDPAETLYFIRKGWVKTTRETVEGQETILAILGPDDMFGHSAIAENAHYPASLIAIEDCTLLSLPALSLRQLITAGGKTALTITTAAMEYSKNLAMQLEHANIMTAPQRIGCFLLKLCGTQTQGSITLSFPHDKALIATYLGMKAETFSRALKTLQEIGITVKGTEVSIREITTLSRYCCNACSGDPKCPFSACDL